MLERTLFKFKAAECHGPRRGRPTLRSLPSACFLPSAGFHSQPVLGKHLASSVGVRRCVLHQLPGSPIYFTTAKVGSACGDCGASGATGGGFKAYTRKDKRLSAHTSRGDAGLGVTSIKLDYRARGVQTGTWAPGPWFCHLTAMRPQASHLTSLPVVSSSVKRGY